MDLMYMVLPALLIMTVLAGVWLERWSVPVILVALGVGMVSGGDVLGIWDFSNARAANQLANLALVFILFQGGFGTRREDLRKVLLPAVGLATWGVVLTALSTFLVLYLGLNWNWAESALIAVIISSTDAAATFSVLQRQKLPQRLSSTLEIESAANDPMAVLLTMTVLQVVAVGQGMKGCEVLLALAWKFAAGPVAGWAMARGALWLFDRLRPREKGHYYVLFLGVVLLTYGLAENVLRASGMLAVYAAGVTMGNRSFVHKQGISNFSAAFSGIANVAMFLLLGLLVAPSEFAHVRIWGRGLQLFATLAFVSRPLAVALGTAGMGFSRKERALLAWAGLRGAVPIVLATYPASEGMAFGNEVFNLVFFAVLLSVLVQGATLGALARRLKFGGRKRQGPSYSLELFTMAKSGMDLLALEMPGKLGAPGPLVKELALPPQAVITLVTRGNRVLSPQGATRLCGGDYVTVLAPVARFDEVRKALEVAARPKTANAQ